jgi:hypothetical protein
MQGYFARSRTAEMPRGSQPAQSSGPIAEIDSVMRKAGALNEEVVGACHEQSPFCLPLAGR